MTDVLTFRFELGEFQRLIAINPSFIIIKSGLEIQTNNLGASVAVMVVQAEGRSAATGDEIMIDGCPVPPCVTS